MPESSPSLPPGTGHRERLRGRFLAGEETALAEETLLELLLTYAIPRQDVAPLARRLLEKFGNLAAVLAAEPSDLKTIRGIKENTLTLLKLAAHLRSVSASVPQSVTAPVEKTMPVAKGVTYPAKKRSKSKPLPEPFSESVEMVGGLEGSGDQSSMLSDVVLDPGWSGETKLQVSNGYSLEPSQIARFLSAIAARPHSKKIPRKEIMEDTGLSYGQTEGLANISVAMGLILPLSQRLTEFGRLVAIHDLFLDSLVTLQFSHFLAAGNPRNLVWHAAFNDLLFRHTPMPQTAWCNWFREKLAGKYSDGSLVKHLAQEVRFLVDAYTVRNLSKLNLLSELPDKALALRRSTTLLPQVHAAMIYAIAERFQTSLFPFQDLHNRPGSPGRLFALDSGSLRQTVESLHQREWLRFEVRHGLDQIRLIEGYSSLEFLAAAYENRAPQLTAPSPQASSEQFLL
jgi:hypothetical protein